jgi:Flp pilus assembly protein TadD
LNKKNSHAYHTRAKIHLQSGKLESALTDLNQAAELDPNNIAILVDRACLCHSLKKYNEAEKDYSRAIMLSPEIASLYYNRGIVYLALHETHKA